MFLEECSARSRFEIFFKVEGNVFVGKGKITNQPDGKSVFGSGNMSFLMSGNSNEQVFSATYIMFIINTHQDINIPEFGDHISIIADCVRRSPTSKVNQRC
jgi:hypothetical protein